MRFAFIAAALTFAAPAFADEPIKFPEKLQRTDFQAMIADAGPLYIAGQPTEEALREMASQGLKTVINLRTQREMDNRAAVPFDEAALLKELGMTYVHIPLGGPDTPYTPEAVEKFATAFEAAEGKALLHCTVAWRASHMWAAYLVKHKGYTREEAVRHGAAMNLNGYSAGGTPLDGLLGASTKPAAN
jgi:uncharacterized protein (TIGR01244 family)